MKRKLVLKKGVQKKAKTEDECSCAERELSESNISTTPIIRERPKDLLLGFHVSIQGKASDKGLHNSVRHAVRLGCNGCFAIFTANQKSWNAEGPTPEIAQKFKDECAKHSFDTKNILPHSSYLINLGCPDAEKLQKSRALFLQEMKRCALLGITMLNFHPGSTLGEITEDECCEKVAESLNWLHQQTDPTLDLSQVVTVMECTAGQGNNIGYKWEHLKLIIDKVNDKSRVGVCIDTCHAFAAGYDLRTDTACEKTFAEFERIVGFKYLRGMHLNDSKGKLNCRSDRHESIGDGLIGKKCFRYLVNDPRFRNIPMVLETPAEKQATELNLLFGLVNE
jgi:apurinic endonuclease APN1